MLQGRDSTSESNRQSSSGFATSALVGNTYRLLRKIGAGASSVVYEAQHIRLGKRFAIKILRPELDPEGRTAQRFRREAQAMALLPSEHIVNVVDCGELADRSPYIVMELLDGEDLRRLLDRERALPARRAIPIIVDACRGLSVMHAAGLVHRDIKPENLFIAKRSSGVELCKVLDLGIVKMESDFATAEGTVLGTVRYMAPEQLTSASVVGPGADVYAVGAVLYECLCGEPMVTGSTVQEVMYQTLNVEPSPVLTKLPSLPPALASLVERCVRKIPAARPPNAGELADLLDSVISNLPGHPALETLSEDSSPFGKSARGAPRLAHGSALSGAVLACAAALSAGWWLRGREEPKPPVTSPTAARAKPPLEKSTATLAPALTSQVVAAPSVALVREAPPQKLAPARRSKAGREAPPLPATGPFDSFNPYGK